MNLELNIDWKRALLIAADVMIGLYLVMVFASWHKPVREGNTCTSVTIDIADDNENGFLKTAEVKKLLESHRMYPLGHQVSKLNTRDIEDQLLQMPFVKTAQCYLTQDNHVHITVTQRTPVLRVKTAQGDDYYVDDNGGVMPNSEYTSDVIIATGNFTRRYATQQLYPVAQMLMNNDLWRNQVEQINITPEGSLEIVPRVGEHIINIGVLPVTSDERKRQQILTEYMERQMHRLELFYKHGLVHAGWRKYDYISLEFQNQIVCRKRRSEKSVEIAKTVEESKESKEAKENTEGRENKENKENKENRESTDNKE